MKMLLGLSNLLLMAQTAALGQQGPTGPTISEKTLFFICREKPVPRNVLSSASTSEGGVWKAYVEVTPDEACLLTTRLSIGKTGSRYRNVYLIPPTRTEGGNGMAILGWAPRSRLLLVRTEAWQWGSDASDNQQVLAFDAANGLVYEPDLRAILDARKGKQCEFRFLDAGFSDDRDPHILVRVRLQTWYDADDTENDIPVERRCPGGEETWSSLQVFKSGH